MTGPRCDGPALVASYAPKQNALTAQETADGWLVQIPEEKEGILKEVLEWDILKFWSGMQDPRGGFYGGISEDGTAEKDAIRDERLNARILWAFSIVYRQLRKKEYLMPAVSAKEFFVQHFLDHKFGGAYTAVDAWGERVNSDASLGNQALAIYSLSEFYRATKDDEALKCAVNLFR